MYTLEPQVATVSASGSVYYSRPGMLSLMCKYSGLVAFPRDTLKCQTEFGGWLMGAGHQGLVPKGGGFSFSQQEDVSGTSVSNS